MPDRCPPHDWVDWSGKKRCRLCGTTMAPLRPAPPPPGDDNRGDSRGGGRGGGRGDKRDGNRDARNGSAGRRGFGGPARHGPGGGGPGGRR